MIVFHEGWAIAFVATVFFVVEAFEDLALEAFGAAAAVVEDMLYVGGYG